MNKSNHIKKGLRSNLLKPLSLLVPGTGVEPVQS
jgi:hypothetical protein